MKRRNMVFMNCILHLFLVIFTSCIKYSNGCKIRKQNFQGLCENFDVIGGHYMDEKLINKKVKEISAKIDDYLNSKRENNKLKIINFD